MTDEITQTSAGELKPGRYVIFDGKPCAVRDVQTSKTGKHGATKCKIEAISLTDDAKIIKIMPASDNVQVPMVEKDNAQVLSVTGNKCNVMDMKTFETLDLGIPEEFKGQIKEGSQVQYWKMLGLRIIKQVK